MSATIWRNIVARLLGIGARRWTVHCLSTLCLAATSGASLGLFFAIGNLFDG